MTIRIGYIDYANCTPIFTALTSVCDCSAYEFVRGVPARLNQMLRQGDIDLCPSSSIEYARAPENYLLLPDLSISSIGPVKSVLLFSRVPIERLDGETIALTVESDTSVNLLKIIMAKVFGFRNTYRSSSALLDEALETCPAVLLIGDRALQSSLGGGYAHVYDLGHLWYQFTGLPFVFALWLVNRRSAAENGEEVQSLAACILSAKNRAYGQYAEIAAQSKERSWMGAEELVSYWRCISYDLTGEHLKGVETFYRYACELGIIEKVPEIAFLY